MCKLIVYLIVMVYYTPSIVFWVPSEKSATVGVWFSFWGSFDPKMKKGEDVAPDFYYDQLLFLHGGRHVGSFPFTKEKGGWFDLWRKIIISH